MPDPSTSPWPFHLFLIQKTFPAYQGPYCRRTEDEIADWPSLLDAFSDRAFPGSEDLFEMMLSNIIAHDTEELDQQYILDEINIMLGYWIYRPRRCPKGAKQW